MITRVFKNLGVYEGDAPMQCVQLERDGYAVLPAVFDADEVRALAAEIDTAFAQYPPEFAGGPWHCDAGPHVPRPEGVAWDDRVPYPVFAIGAHLLLRDCTKADGPTAVVPGSHRSGRLAPFDRIWDPDLAYDGRGPVRLEGRAGDVALFVSDVWHRARSLIGLHDPFFYNG